MGAVSAITELVDGIPIIHHSKLTSCICEACLYGKMACKPFPALDEKSRAINILEIIHSDILRPMENVSLHGSRFVLLFIDDKTRYKHCYFLKRKSDAIVCFQNYKAMVEKLHGREIGNFRTDGGGE
jgi:hypothetical protein